MKNLTRALAFTVLAATVPATIVVAQQAQTEQDQTQNDQDQKSTHRHGPSAETLDRLEDGRIAMAKTALKLTPDQEKLWAPVEEKLRATYADRRKAREEWRAKREEHRAEQGDKQEKLALPERIERRSQMMAERATKLNERAEKTKAYAETLKPFYASLSDEQKEVAQHVLRFGNEHRGGFRGHRWAMNDDGHGRGHARD